MKRFATLLILLAATAAVLGVTTSARAAHSDAPPVVTQFPAAGTLTVNTVVVRHDADPQSAKVKTMHYFRKDYFVQEYLAIGSTTGSDGQTWYQIEIPMRPNGTLGWVPAADLDLRPTHAEIVVDRGHRTIDVYKDGKLKLHSIVAVGAPGMETPTGNFYVALRFVPYHDPFLGVFALETSAYSKLTEWPGGGVVGIHGTNEPWLLGKAVSHGCVRVSNATAAKLKHLAPLGTPITIKD